MIRYEGHLTRQMTTALHTLERLQSARVGVPVPPPTAVDVTINGLITEGEVGSFGSGAWFSPSRAVGLFAKDFGKKRTRVIAMGGLGSGRWGWHRKATTVEACLDLDLGVFSRGGRAMVPGMTGTLRWIKDGVEKSSVNYTVSTGPVIRLRYQKADRPDEPIECPFRLELVPSVRGGKRWYGRCPLIVNGLFCGRRVCVLYLPPRERYFGCRTCHRLAYRSSQDSDPRISRIRREGPAFLDRFSQPGKFPIREPVLGLRLLTSEQTRWDRTAHRFRRYDGTWPRNEIAFDPTTPPSRSTP